MNNVVHLHDFRGKKDPVTVFIEEIKSGKNPQFKVHSYYFGDTHISMNEAQNALPKYLKNLKNYVLVINRSHNSQSLCEACEEAELNYSEVHQGLYDGLKEGKFKAQLG